MFSQLYISDISPFENFDLVRDLQKTPDHIRSEIRKSQLQDSGIYNRCFAANFDSSHKYEVLVVNGAECFFCAGKDALLLYKHPKTILEGAILSAIALNVSEVCLVVHGALLEHYDALVTARDEALSLNIIGAHSRAKINVHIRLSNGTLSGAHTHAVLRHLEGERGVNKGDATLLGRSALVGNVETVFAVPTICAKGASWWSEHMPKIFMLQGSSLNQSVVWAGANDKLVSIIEKHSKAVDWNNVKCVFPGGLFSKPLRGSCLKNAVLNSQYMTQNKTTMQSGSVLVVFQQDSLVQIFLHFMRSAVKERNMCCVGCREGLPFVQEALEFDDVKKAAHAAALAMRACDCSYSALVVKGFLASFEMGVL